MRRRGLAMIGVPLIVVALAVVYVGSVSMSGRRDVDPVALLLPETVDSGTAFGAGRSTATTDEPGHGAAANQTRKWQFAAGGGELTQRVRRYARPLNAEHHYLADHPKDEYERGFHEKDASDQYDSPHADRSTTFCGAGSPSGCRNWIYWARYGQYLVQLEFAVADTDVPVDAFAAFLKRLDAHVAAAS